MHFCRLLSAPRSLALGTGELTPSLSGCRGLAHRGSSITRRLPRTPSTSTNLPPCRHRVDQAKRGFSVPGGPSPRGLSEVRARCESSDEPLGDTTKTVQHRPDINVVLVHPQIPQNAGNVARTCAATGVALHLVRPIGFDIDDKKLRRAGLDYWPYVVVDVHDSWEDFASFFESLPGPKRLMAFSKFGKSHYAAPGKYQPGDWLMFGSEIDGLPPEAHEACVDSGGTVVKIPMQQTHVRSINLSVSVGVGLYEAIRQLDEPTEATVV